jgi:hypothetical protein
MTLANLGLDVDAALEYWPVILILVGIGKLAAVSIRAGLFWVLAGALLLVPKLTDRVDLGDLWPALLVLLGLGLVTRSLGGSSERAPRPSRAESVDEMRLFAFFASPKRRVTSQRFRGGNLVALLGGCEIDLREAGLEDSAATLEVLAMWGGIALRVPKEWKVSLDVTPVMGGAEDNRTSAEASFEPDDGVETPRRAGEAALEETPHLLVRGLALMGGVDIRT